MGFRLIFVFFLVLGLTACASGPKSRAMEIATWGGIEEGLKDLSVERFKKVYKVDDTNQAGVDAALLAGTSSGLIASSAINLNLFVLDGIIGNILDSQRKWRSPHVLWWAPEDDMPSDFEGAAMFAVRMLEEAAKKALPVRYFLVRDKLYTSKHYGQTYKVFNKDNGFEFYLYIGIGNRRPPLSVIAPKKLGEFRAKTFNHYLTITSEFEKNRKPPFNLVKFYTEVSRNLPKSAFLYLAPKKFVTAYPVILDHGKVFLFIKPSS